MSVQTAELVVPAVAAGALLPGLVLFGYVAARSGERTQYAVTIITLLGILFTIGEVFVVHVGGIQGELAASFQVRRLQQISAAWFLPAVPFFLSTVVPAGTRALRMNRIATYAGLAAAVVLTLIAFVEPDWFSSVTQGAAGGDNFRSARGRGAGGWALDLRDGLLAATVVYALAFIATVLRAHESPAYLIPSLVGLGLGLLFGADDIVHRLTGTHIGVLSGVLYPRTVVGVTMFVFGAMISSTTRYVESSRQVARAHEELREHERELSYLAFYDQLTHVRNRKAFYRQLGSALGGGNRQGDPGRLALLYVDLDRFKEVNDGYGHATGDTVLREAAARFTRSIRRSDELFRLGGDEFIVMLTQIREPEDAGIVADKLIRSLEQPIQVDGRAFYLGASVGISLSPQDGASPEELVQAADRALYAAKRDGNTSMYHDTGIQNTSIRNLRIVSGLHDAVREEQFYLHYQPILDTDGRLASAEALLRWQHPVWGAIPTATFIHVAEQSRLIVQVGKWVIERACADAARLREAGVSAPVSINISTKQLVRTDFLDHLRGELRDNGLTTADLWLEITESSLMDDPNTMGTRLLEAQRSGIRFMVDDFGKGYSTLAYLKHLPINGVKIDRSFIRELPQSGEDVAILNGVLEIARGLGIHVVAEGVETEAQRDYLSGVSVEYYQGFLFGRPAPLEDLVATYAPRRRNVRGGSRPG